MRVYTFCLMFIAVLIAGCGGGDTGNGNTDGDTVDGDTVDGDTVDGDTVDGDTDRGDHRSAASCLAAGESTDPNGHYTLPALEEGPQPDHGPAMMAEHMAMLALVAYDQTTHAAVNNGAWCDPDTWHNRTVPGDGAHVVISEDTAVTYSMVDPARLKTVRVDGHLSFATDEPSRLIVDTMVVDERGTLLIGTEDDPVLPGVDVEIMIADNGDIDTHWDRMLLSRGLISHGTTRIHGSRKTSHVKVDIDPRQEDHVLSLAETPENWRIGDILVIAGTRYTGWNWDNDPGEVRYYGTQDEVREISAINGRTVTLDVPLEYDHSSPRSDLTASVANYTRNISIETENSASLPPHQRGHVMFMHSDDIDVRYAAFDGLGRTDKSTPSRNVNDVSDIQSDSNVQGRYSFHFHRTGTENQRNPATAVGNAVFDSPGWGFAHHDSHADLYDNASFDTFGAGFVAETGNETGTWARNIAIRAQGNSANNPKNGNDPDTFDMARSGAGFWFQGRMVDSFDNIAAGVNHGFVYFHRDNGEAMLSFAPQLFMLPEALGLGSPSDADAVPIRAFDGNEAFASTFGLFVVKANPRQNHDIMTVLSDFTAWEVRTGTEIEYTAHYLLKDFDLIGSTPGRFQDKPEVGIAFKNNTTNMVVNGGSISGFPDGIELGKTHVGFDKGLDQFVIIEPGFIDVQNELVNFDPEVDLWMDAEDLHPGRFAVSLDGELKFPDPNDRVVYTGTKTDSIGASPLPAGIDSLSTSAREMMTIVGTRGYYHDADGDAYAVVKGHFADRATGEIHKLGLKTYLGENVEGAIGTNFRSWGDAIFNGMIDLSSQPPVANDVYATTEFETVVVIDLLANDSDPEGDPLSVDGMVQPRNGRVHDNGDGTVSYHPGIGYSGDDNFYYWVTDHQGNYSRADVTVTVFAR